MNNHAFDSSPGRQYSLEDSFRKDMHDLLDSGIGSDVSFIINGISTGIRAHSSIVAVRCKTIRAEVCKFRASVKDGENQEQPTLEIPIEAVSLRTFRKVLKYVYTGTIALQATDIYDVCSLSARLGIGSLQSIVFAHLRKEDNVRQITTVLDRALQNAEQNRLLVARLTEYFAENCSKVLQDAPFEELSDNLMQHIVKQENLGASEYEIWDALIKWSCTQSNIVPVKRVSMMTESEKKLVAGHMKDFCRPGYLRILNFDAETFAKEVEPLGVFPSPEVLLKYRFDAAAGNAAFEHAFSGDRYSFLLRIRQRTTCYESSSHPHPRGVSETVKVQLPRWVTEMKVVFDPRTALGRYADLEFCTDEGRTERIYSVRASEVPGTMCLLSEVRANTPYWSESCPENVNERSTVSARPLGVDPIWIAGNCFWFTFYSPQNVGDSAWGNERYVSTRTLSMDDVFPYEVASVLPAYLLQAIPFKNFNKMQVECLEAWNSDSNLLVSAPTGSGKTVCFELALLRQVHNVLESSRSKHLGSTGLSGKVVFIAPTKALCAERGNDWKQRYRFIGLRVEVITGDVSISASDSKLLNADLILTTAEKWDSLTKNIGSQSASDLMSQISLLLLDEVHQLGDSRGAIFESVVTRMLVTSDEVNRNASSVTCSAPIASLRLIAVSATVKNVEDVGAWLRVDPDHIKAFDQSYRPVELEYKVLGYHIRNAWQSSKVYDSRMLEVLRRFNDEKPALVFCPSRRQTSLSAQALVAHLNRDCPDSITRGNALTRHLSVEQRRRLCSYAANCSDRALAVLLPSGVAVHNAEMSPENRLLVERLFRDSLVLCLFSTSTLAQGVNLPARLVVIAGTAVYHDGSLQEYDRNMLLQMCGRAGRTGLDTKGVAVIMTSSSNKRKYEHIQKAAPESLESQLESSLEESINAEIARQSIIDVPSAVFFLTNTFFCIREKAKCGSEYQKDQGKVKTILTSAAVKAVDKLENMHLVRFDDDHFGVSCTSAGVAMAKYCLSFETMRLMMTEVPKASSPVQVLRIISATPEVLDGVCVRRAEKKRLNQMNEFIRLPIRGKVKESVDKAIILLQMVMGDFLDTANVDFALRSEALRLMQSVSRVCGCLLSLILDRPLRAPYDAIFSVLQVCRGLMNHCYWDGPTVLRQIPGVTAAKAKALAKHGISSIAAIVRADFGVIDDLVSAKAPFGKRVLERVKDFPKFHVRTTARKRADSGGQISEIEAYVTVSSQIGHWRPRQRNGKRGFILVGSHSRGLIDVRTFRLDESDQQFLFHVPVDDCPRRGKWIDVIVGSENVIGIDECERFRLDEGNDGLAEAKKSTREGVKEEKPSGQTTRLSVMHGRVSKRFLQRTMSQTLGQISKRAMTADFRREVVFKRTVNGKAYQSQQTGLSKGAPDAASPNTSPDTSPGPSSPLPCESTGDSVAAQVSVAQGPEKLLQGGKRTTAGHGRFEALFAEQKVRPYTEHTSHPNALGEKDSYCITKKSTDVSDVSQASGADKSCREYDDMLRNLF